MLVTQTFKNSVGVVTSALVDFDGVPLLAQLVDGAVRLCTWGPAQGDAAENPGWKKLEELNAQKLAEYVFIGFSAQHDDHFLWTGGPIPGLTDAP